MSLTLQPTRRWAFALGALCAAQAALAQTAAAPAPEGLWRFVDDGSVVQFSACGLLSCATLRKLPEPAKAEPGPQPRCGTLVIADMKAIAGGAHYGGVAIDPVDNKRYKAELRPAAGGRLELVIKALGGLYTETLVMERVAPPVELCQP
jgi:uncharacterized protein (DUF2147 family)